MSEDNAHNPRGHYGVGIYSPQAAVTVGGLIRAAACFGADYVITVGERQRPTKAAVGHHKHLPVFHVENWNQLENTIPQNSEIVLVDYDESAYSADEFHHPERALYMIGQEGPGFPDEILEKGYRKVYFNSEFCMNAIVAGNMILRERYRDERD